MKFQIRSFCLLVLLTFSFLVQAGPEGQVEKQITSEQEQGFSVAKLVDQLEIYSEREKQIRAQSEEFIQPDELSENFSSLQDDLKALAEELDRARAFSSWGALKVDDFLEKARPLYARAKELREEYLNYLKSTELLQNELKAQKDSFKTALNELPSDPLFAKQRSTVKVSLQKVKELNEELQNQSAENTKIYSNSKDLLDQIEELQQSLREEKHHYQQQIFERSQPSFIYQQFWKKFDHNLIQEIKQSWQSVIAFDFIFYRGESGNFFRIGLSVLVVLALTLFLRKRFGFPISPLALALAAGIASGWFLIEVPHPLFILAAWTVMPLLLYQLVKSYHFYPKTSSYLLGIFLAYSMTKIVEVIEFPLVLYRIFIFVLSGFLCFYSWWQYRKITDWEKQSFWKRAMFLVTIGLFLVTAIAQAAGFHLFSVFLVYGAIHSAFLVFALLFARQIVFHLLSFISKLDAFCQFSVVKKYRHAFLAKFNLFLKGLVFLFFVLYLPTIWRIYSSAPQAFEEIMGFGISLSDHRVTVGMLLEAVLYFYFAYFVAFVFCALLEDEFYPRRQVERGTANSINKLVNYFFWIIGAFLAFFSLGFDLQQLAIIAGALSVGIGFGLQNIVNNFVSGIILLFERPVKVGDVLEINGELGEVEKMGLRSTIIRTISKTQLIIPNSDFITQTVENLTLTDSEYRQTIPIGIAYGSDTKKAQELILGVLKKHEMVLDNPEPQVFFSGFGDSSLNFDAWIWLQNVADRKQITSDVLFEVDQVFRDNGIEIPFPQRDLHLRSVDEKVMKSFGGKGDVG